MNKKKQNRAPNHPKKFGFLTGLSIVSVILILFLAYSFYIALSENLIDTRKEFLNKQVELASNEVQRRFSNLEDDLIFYTNNIENTSVTQPGEEEVAFDEIRVRRLLNNYLYLIDTLFVQNGDKKVFFLINSKNYFEKQEIGEKFPDQTCSGCVLIQSNKGQVKLLAKLSIDFFFKTLLSNYYLGPNGLKFYYDNGNITYLGNDNNEVLTSPFSGKLKEEIKREIKGGLRGDYIGDLLLEKEERAKAVVVQYPFQLNSLSSSYAFIFAQERSSIISGIYGTYFYLFAALFGVLGFIFYLMFKLFKTSNENNLLLERKSKDINQLYRQQTLLLQQTKGFIYYHNKSWEIYNVSENVKDVLGYSPEEFMQLSKKIISKEELTELHDKVREAIGSKKEFFYFEVELERKDGTKIKTKSFEKLIFDDQGEFVGSAGICTDINEKHLSEQELIKSENRLRLVLNSLPDIIFIYNSQGMFLDYYVQNEGLLMEPPHQSIGKSIMEVLPYPVNERLMHSFNRAVKTGKTQTQEIEINTEMGKRFFEVRFFKLDEDKVISIARDISSQKLWEKGLREAKEAAESASKEKTEFLTNMSHEIRTPLNGLIGILGLFYKTPLNEQQKKYLEILNDSGNSLLNIVNDILDYSKIEAGKLELNPMSFDFRYEVDRLINIFQALLSEKNIRLNKNISAKIPQFVLLDKDKLYQILFNILGNAIKFTPNGGNISLAITSEYVFTNNLILSFSVKDNGIGIPAEKIKYLTQPFIQVENKNYRKEKGTGLGLAIASKLIELMGGVLQIDSEVGFGSEFSFTIVSQIPEIQEVRPKENFNTSEEDNFNEMAKDFPVKILLVEDNDINLRFMTMLLNQMGYLPDIAKNGLEAVEKVNRNDYDLVFMDNQMPEMNGIEATSLIRKSNKVNKPYIIGLSANVFVDHIDDAYKAGMNDYLTKPVKIKDIVESIKKCFKNIVLEN